MQPLLIFDKNNHTFTAPKVILKDYFSLTPSSVLGGEETLSFSIPATSFLFESEDYVLFENKRYVIKRHTKRRDDTGVSIEVSCEGLYAMLIDYYVDGEDTWLQGVSVRTALERILRGTPFSVGKCDDFGTWDIELKELNCLEAINEVRDKWPATMEIYFDGFTLNALVVRGNDTGYQIHYNKNLVDIERIVDSAGVVTRLVGLGAEGLTIEGLSESQVVDKDGVHISGGKVVAKYIDAPNIGEFSHPKMYYEDFSDISNQKDLLEKMQSWLLQRYTPKLTYTVNFAEMVRQGVPYSDINIGDFVNINDPEFGAIKLRVVELSKDAFNIEHSTVTLGERYKTLEDYLGDFDASKDVWEELGGGKLDGILESAIKEATEWLNNGQNTCFITENDGIICADRTSLGPNGEISNNTRLIKMSSGAIGCSVDGGQTYRSAMTPEGVVADAIIGGRIHSSHITVGDASLFEDGYSPSEIRKPLAVEFDIHKQNTGGSVANVDKKVEVLNQSVGQTNTAITNVQKDLQEKIDILSTDVSGLNGDMSTMENMYNNVNNMLFGDSYFRWTEQGIHATDIDNPFYQMLLGAKGIGFSTDGGKIFENAITAQGIVASQVNIGTFGDGPFKGLTIRNGMGQETLAIDTNGNVSLMGNINMQGGAINWQNVSKVTYDSLDPAVRDKFTWIDSSGVYTGKVKTRQLELDGAFEVTKNGKTTFLISQDGSVYMNGSIHLSSGSVIDWNNTNAPSADKVGATSKEEMEAYKNQTNKRLTRITEDGIYTGTIDAGLIRVTGPKIPANAVNIKASDIGAATVGQLSSLEGQIDSKVNSANSYLTNWANDMSKDLRDLERDMITASNVTEITHNSIKTAKISAGQIYGGTLAGVRIYCDNIITIGSQTNSYNPTIQFKPNNNFTAITYKNNSYLAMQCDEDIAIYAGGKLYFQNSWGDTMFSKNGSTRPGSGSYVSMHAIIAKINECCRKLGLTQL